MSVSSPVSPPAPLTLANSATASPVSLTPWEDSAGDEKRCWICFVEEGEDRNPGAAVQPPSVWVRPCKCKNSLKYTHEDCLLRWISEKQHQLPPPLSSGSSGAQPVRCPACAHPYQLIEDTDGVLNVLAWLDKAIGTVVPYVSLGTVSLAVYVVATTYGAYAVMTMCGADVGETLLSDNNWGWRTWVGLPTIPLSLVCSRLTAADAALPLLPFLILGNDHIRLGFPPSPALTVCILPWARLLYNAIWERITPLFDRFFDPPPRYALSGPPASGRTSFFATARQYWRILMSRRDDEGRRLRAAGEEDEDDGAGGNGRNYDDEVPRRDGQRLVLGSLFLPAAAQISGTLLASLPYLRARLPADTFHRNIVGGAILVVAKDIAAVVYRAHRRRQKRSRRVLDYRGD
ncbi:hypothetical protein HDU88_007743 [Geranomyces variabilis]|nr:hypothetical protein HDU88_007743 [Geranomyces variabilis]